MLMPKNPCDLVLRGICLSGLCFVLAGCTGSMTHMRSWMGVTEATLLETLGPAHRTHTTDRATQLAWYRDATERMGCLDTFTLKQGRIVGFASNCGIWGGFGVPRYTVASTQAVRSAP